MLRRLAALGAAAIALALHAGGAGASPADGPRLAFTRWGPAPDQFALRTVDALGGDLRRVIAGRGEQVGLPAPFGRPSWFADGSLLAYSGRGRGGKNAIFVVRPDGTGLRQLPKTVGGKHPVVSPDGRYIAFSRTRLVEPRFNPKRPLESLLRDGFSGSTAWLLDLVSGGQKRLTPWRDGLHVEPSSFYPNGSTLALSRSEGGDAEAIEMALTTRAVTVLARHAKEPVYSPDGTQIAFVSYRDRNVTEGFGERVLAAELYVRSRQDGRLLRLTHTEKWQEGAPSWDPSGQRLAYTQSTGEEPFGLGFTNVIKQVNADGTCRQLLFGEAAKRTAETLDKAIALHGPSWQPSPGREAGRIEC